MFFSHLLDVAVPTPFVTELPPTKTGQHLDVERTVQIVSKHKKKMRDIEGNKNQSIFPCKKYAEYRPYFEV